MKEKTMISVGRNDFMFVKGKAKKKAIKITSYVNGIVSFAPHGCFNYEVKTYKNKLPKIYLIVCVCSVKHPKGNNTVVSFNAIKGYTHITDDIRNNVLRTEKGNDGSCTWVVKFYIKVNNMKYTRDELVKKALKYAKKKGVKIYKNHLSIR